MEIPNDLIELGYLFFLKGYNNEKLNINIYLYKIPMKQRRNFQRFADVCYNEGINYQNKTFNPDTIKQELRVGLSKVK